MNRFSALIKPASSLCDMRCRYCFYCDEAAEREQASYGLMRTETAHALIDRVYDCLSPRAQVNFAFQGGEPTLAGLPFFADFVAYAHSQNTKNAQLSWSIQTNGLSIDENWACFFAQNKFLVGLSLDASADFHDQNRVDSAGKGTFSHVMRARRTLLQFGVDVNVLTVLTRQLAAHPRAVFQAYQKNQVDYVQLIPCLRALDGEARTHDLMGEDYASFMKAFFGLWFDARAKGETMHVRYFDNLIALARGEACEQCGASGECTPQFVVEGDGSIYPCDFYALDEFCLGNVHTHSVKDTLESDGMRAFAQNFAPIGSMCAACEVFALCGGGCRRYRSFYQRKDGYCPQQDFLKNIAQRLVYLARTASG